MTDFPIETMKAGPRAYITRTAGMKDIPKAMMEGFATLSERFAKANAPMTGMPMAHYLTYDKGSTTFELGFPCRSEDEVALRAAGLSIGKTPEGRSMKATHIGPYDTVVSTYNAMIADMQARGLVPARDMWEIYCSPPETPPSEIRTDVVWPLVA
jgi:effector-binding domain-containing protein